MDVLDGSTTKTTHAKIVMEVVKPVTGTQIRIVFPVGKDHTIIKMSVSVLVLMVLLE